MCLCEMLWDSQHKRIMISHQFSSLLEFWFHSMFVKYPLFQLNKKKEYIKLMKIKKESHQTRTLWIDRNRILIRVFFFDDDIREWSTKPIICHVLQICCCLTKFFLCCLLLLCVFALIPFEHIKSNEMGNGGIGERKMSCLSRITKWNEDLFFLVRM